MSSSSSLDCLELCRLCLEKERVSVPIFENEGDVRQIFLKITACLPVKVSRDDKLPKKICDDCLYKVELFYQFWNTTANAEKQLLQWLGEVGGLEDGVPEVLVSNVMKQEQASDSRLEGRVVQVGGQNSVDMGMIENMTIITMPVDGEQQFASVPMDTSGTVTVQAVASSSASANDQSQTSVSHLADEVEDDDDDDDDDGCDNEGMPVKEENEEDQSDRVLDQSSFVTIPCDEAGPSGLQQKIADISNMSLQPTEVNDPKTGITIKLEPIDEEPTFISEPTKSSLLEPRVSLTRLTNLEIDMLRSQLREQVWIKQEAEENDDSDDFELFLPPTPPLLEKPSLVPYKPHQKKRRLKRRKLHTPYCRICKKYFHSYNQLSYHRRLTHKKQQESEESKNNNHPDTDPLELEPPKADLSQVDDDDSKDERFEYRPLLPCRDCLRYFTCPRELLQHRQYLDCLKREPDEESSLSEVTDDEYEYDILYSCTTCRAKFISTRLLELHRRREGHHHTTTKTAQKKVLDDEVDGIIGSKEDESEFVYKSVEEGEFLCAVCDNGVVYLDPDDLLKHHRAVHSAKNLMHYCRYCAHEVKGPAEFADHHLAYHQMRQFCRLCPDAKDKLVQYRKGLPPKPVCPECARKSDMPFDHCLKLLQENLYCDNCDGSLPSIAHVRFHNCTTEPPGPHKMLSLLACPLCLEGFNGLRSLYRHILSHNDLMRYSCDECGRAIGTWKQLKAHKSSKHGETQLSLQRFDTDEMRKSAEAVVARFVKNGVELLM